MNTYAIQTLEIQKHRLIHMAASIVADHTVPEMDRAAAAKQIQADINDLESAIRKLSGRLGKVAVYTN